MHPREFNDSKAVRTDQANDGLLESKLARFPSRSLVASWIHESG